MATKEAAHLDTYSNYSKRAHGETCDIENVKSTQVLGVRNIKAPFGQPLSDHASHGKSVL